MHTPFALLDETIDRLEKAYRAINGPDSLLFPFKMTQLGLLLQEICKEHTDSFLAALYLNEKHDALYLHALYIAVLCDILSKHLNIGDANRLPLILAALTHDIGMLKYHQVLSRQSESLSPDQIRNIREHPLAGAHALKKMGITDKVWITAVLQHHERSDGSGYPYQLSGSKIMMPSKMLMLCDTYAAMICPRSHRTPIMPEKVLRELLIDQGKTIDRGTAELLIKHIGIYPPGALVKLKNKEIAVVVTRTGNVTSPLVSPCLAVSGGIKVNKIIRDTSVAEYKIIKGLPLHKYNSLKSVIRDRWSENINIALYN